MSGGARCIGLSTCALLLAVAPVAFRFLRAAAVLAELTGAPLPAAGRPFLHAGVVEQSVELGGLRARRYAPRHTQAGAGASVPVPGVLLLHGMHARGIEEPRLVAFARTLARGGLDVLTPELTELRDFHLGTRTIAEIRALAELHAGLTHSAAVGVIGISFAGGLALIAASEQAAAKPIGFVATVGAHHDLLRLCEYYARRDVRGPDGEKTDVPPHPYGARVMLRDQLARFVGPADLPGANRALDSYLHDQPREARRLAEELSPGAQRVMAVLLDSAPSETLSGWLLRVSELSRLQLTAASPRGHLANLRVPVLLLHGAGDPIIPSLETAYLAREVPRPWLRRVVVSKLLRHAEFPQAPAPMQAFELVRFVQQLYEAAGSAATAR